jgi:lipopolysaccharide transport system permease protein
MNYRRSALGPFWITLSMAILILTIGMVFGLLFNVSLKSYLPYLASGIVLWSFITSTLGDGCQTYLASEGLIRQMHIPYSFHTLRVIFRNTFILGHNIILLPICFLVLGNSPSWSMLLFIPGFILLASNLTWMSILLGLLSSRFRDMPPIVGSVLTVGFYLTPVMWDPSAIPGTTAHYLLGFNPLYHLLQIVRLPLLGLVPTSENYLLSTALLAVGGTVTFVIFRRFKSRIPFWV